MSRAVLLYPRLIICEGASDEAFFRKLIKNRGLPPFCVRHTGDFDPANKGGKSKFGKFLQGLPTWHGFYSLQSKGFTINLSGNNPAHADDLADMQAGPVTTVLPSDQTENTTTPAGRKIVVCPAVTRDDVSCSTCGLCAVRDRKVIIGFPAHGSSRKRASSIASN